MKCFEITINGEKVCTASVGDDGVLASTVTFVRRNNASAETVDAQSNSYSLDLRVGGLANREPGVTEQLEWLNQALAVGDEVVIRIIEASSCDDPKSKEVTYVECSFCGKRQADVAKLIAGPAVYICSECVGDCGAALANGEPSGIITMVLSKTAEARCSFCGQKPIEVERIVGVRTARICNQCVKICGDILVAGV
jgi:hypothetical protein